MWYACTCMVRGLEGEGGMKLAILLVALGLVSSVTLLAETSVS